MIALYYNIYKMKKPQTIYIFLDDRLTSWNVAFVVKNEHSKQSSNENVLANKIICITFVCSLKKKESR